MLCMESQKAAEAASDELILTIDSVHHQQHGNGVLPHHQGSPYLLFEQLQGCLSRRLQLHLMLLQLLLDCSALGAPVLQDLGSSCNPGSCLCPAGPWRQQLV